MKTKTKTFSNEEDFRHFIELLESKDIKYIVVYYRALDDAAFLFYSLAHSIAYGEDPKIEHLLRGEIVVHDGDRILTNKDEFINASYGEDCYFYTVPGISKLYEFLTGDSIDKTKNYKIPGQYYPIFDIIPKEERWFDIIYRNGEAHLKCKSSKASESPKYIPIDPLKL